MTSEGIKGTGRPQGGSKFRKDQFEVGSPYPKTRRYMAQRSKFACHPCSGTGDGVVGTGIWDSLVPPSRTRNLDPLR